MGVVWQFAAPPIAALVAAGSADLASSSMSSIIVAGLGAFGLIGAAIFTGRRWEGRGDSGERPTVAEVARLRRERDEAIAERDECRDMNERLLHHMLPPEDPTGHDREQPHD